MVTKRILLFGGNGQVGQALQKQELPADWHMGVLTRAECDLRQGGAVVKAIRDFEPDIVINAAALTDIDICEADRELALAVNFNAVAAMAGACVECDAPLIQISTDYVFDGRDGNKPYEPDAAMNPVNVYGLSKMMGEEAARHGLYWHVILRTSLVFSAYGGNVLIKSLRQIDSTGSFTAVTDQTSNPTGADSLAQGLVTIADTVLSGKANCFGTFHLCNTPSTSRYEFAQVIAASYAPLVQRTPLVTGVSSHDLAGRVARPSYSAMNCDKTFAIYGIKSHSWHDELNAAVKSYASNKQHSEKNR
jgi:dTDP-4-dehydrorhamnose reductase